MFSTLATFLLPPIFVFGIYHVLTWFDAGGINQRAFWKRLAMASAVSHVLLATGFFVFTYFESGDATSFGAHLLDQSNFWKLMLYYDTAPMLAIVALFSLLDRAGVNPPGLIAITIAITYLVGTLQWFLIGGALGALGERFFEGLRTPDPEDEWFDS
jgi:hypothetical protein